jgi:L-malate glycosyltransferase
MTVLIITSESLNPKNILSSTFELTQAEILSDRFDVGIISVNINGSLSHFIKAFKNLFNKNNNKKETLINLLRAVNFIFLGKSYVNKHLINGINVYEGIGYKLLSRSSFKSEIGYWTKIGMNAYRLYCKEKSCPSIIHAHGRFLMAGILALKIKQNYNIPYVYTEHSTYYQREIAPAESKTYLNKIAEEASFFITVSRPLLQSVSTFLGKEPSRTLIIPNVLDKIFETPTKIKKNTIFTFIIVASLDYKKGIDILLKSFKNAFGDFPSVQLLICGDGPLKNNLEILSTELGIKDTVKFLGNKSKKEVKELMDNANALVLSSRVETFGVVIIEALARGCPVIATKSGGPEFILRKNWGILVEPEDEIELAKALHEIKDNYYSYNSVKIHEECLLSYGSKAFLKNMERIYYSLNDTTL